MRFNAPFARTASQNLNACNWQCNFMNYDSNHNTIRICKPNIITCRVDECCMVLVKSNRIGTKIYKWNFLVKFKANSELYRHIERKELLQEKLRIWFEIPCILETTHICGGIINEYLHITRTINVFLDVSIQMSTFEIFQTKGIFALDSTLIIRSL